MKKIAYTAPALQRIFLYAEDLMQTPGVSRWDNDGDGTDDQRPTIIGDPTDGIGSNGRLFNDMWDSKGWGGW